MTDAAPIIIDSHKDLPVNAAIVWLHGLGADGNDFVPVINELELPAGLNIRFIFPHAPIMPVSINQGYRMRAWYDLYSLTTVEGEDESGIQASSDWLAQLCDQLRADNIAADRIILAGFSQGGAVALHCGVRYPHQLAGIMALSTYMPRPASLQHEISAHAAKTPVFMAHGRQDDVLNIELARHSMLRMQNAGLSPQWHEYDMPHSLCAEEISDISQWLNSVLNAVA